MKPVMFTYYIVLMVLTSLAYIAEGVAIVQQFTSSAGSFSGLGLLTTAFIAVAFIDVARSHREIVCTYMNLL